MYAVSNMLEFAHACVRRLTFAAVGMRQTVVEQDCSRVLSVSESVQTQSTVCCGYNSHGTSLSEFDKSVKII